MKGKNLIAFLSILILLSTLVSAGDFIIQYPAGTEIFKVDTSGNVNASGWIAEAGVSLTSKYWEITDSLVGDVTGTAGATTVVNTQGLDYHNVTTGMPTCTGTVLTFDGTDLSCVSKAIDIDTHVKADGVYLYNDTDTMYFNQTLNNETIDNRISLTGDFVSKTGDTMTGDLNFSGAGVGITNLKELTAAGNLDIGAFDFKALSFESDVAAGTAPIVVASVTEVANLNVSFAGEAYDLTCVGCVADAELATDYVEVAGDTMTGELIMDSANIDMQGSNITSTTGDVIIILS